MNSVHWKIERSLAGRTNPEGVDIIGFHESVHATPPSPEHLFVKHTVVGVFREAAAPGVFALSGGDAELTAFGAWALVQGLAQFEQRQRPELAVGVGSHHIQITQTFVDGLKRGPEGPGSEEASGGN